MSTLSRELRPELCADGAGDKLVHGLLRRVQATVVAQVLALSAAVVMKSAHVAWIEPGGVDAEDAECQSTAAFHARVVDVGDADQTVAVLPQHPIVCLGESLHLAVEPYSQIAHCHGTDGIGATTDEQQHVKLLFTTIFECFADSLHTINIIMYARLLTGNEETMGLVVVLRFIDLVERLLAALLIGVVTTLGKDGVGGCGPAHVHLVTLGNTYLTDGTPTVSRQVLRLDTLTPTTEINAPETINKRDAGQSTDFLGTRRTLFRFGFVDTLFQLLLNAIALGQFLQSHAELVLTIATFPEEEVDG